MYVQRFVVSAGKGLAALCAAAFVFAAPAQAAIAGFTYIGSGSPNDSESAVNAVISPETTTWLAKLDCDNDACSSATGEDKAIAANLFSYIVTNYNGEGEAVAGTFSFDISATGYLLEYLIVKAGPTFAVYALNTPAASGVFDWNTLDLGGKGLSHLSFYGDIGEIPLPGAVWLMLAGIAGLGFARRRAA